MSWAASSGAAGRYLSSSADVLSYHTGDRADITWDSTFGFYSNGEAAIEQAVADGTSAAIVLPSGPSGDPAQDAGQAVLRRALASSERYEALTVPGNQAGTWLVYARR